MAIEYCVARSEEEREQIYRFRYRIYVQELGLHPPEADHVDKRVRDEFDPYSTIYALRDDDSGAVVGTIRATYMAQLPDASPFIAKYEMGPAVSAFGLAALSATGRFMLDPSVRGGQASQQLLLGGYADTRNAGIRINFSDCSPYLIRFEERLGQRRYIPPFEDAAFGFKLRIMMVMGDREHLFRCRSPLAPLAESFPDDAEARAWFAATYPQWVRPPSAGFVPPRDFFDLLTEHIGNDPIHAIGLFRGLSSEQTAQFLASSTIITAAAGERVLRENERDPTVFILLKGLAEVIRDEAPGRVVATLGAGDVFGEIGFLTGSPRSATVVARAPCEILTLSADFLRQFVTENATIAARVLFNLARILAARLAQTTFGLSADAAIADPESGLRAGSTGSEQ
jgi:CRP-like cAMP-binding protein